MISFLYERHTNVLLLVIFPLFIGEYENLEFRLCMN